MLLADEGRFSGTDEACNPPQTTNLSPKAKDASLGSQRQAMQVILLAVQSRHGGMQQGRVMQRGASLGRSLAQGLADQHTFSLPEEHQVSVNLQHCRRIPVLPQSSILIEGTCCTQWQPSAIQAFKIDKVGHQRAQL